MTAVLSSALSGVIAPPPTRAVAVSVALSYANAVMTPICGALVLAVALRHFEASLYGLWLVIGSLLGYIRLADGGIVTATNMLLARARTVVDLAAALWRSATLLAGIAVLLTTAGSLILTLNPEWGAVFNVQDPAIRREAEVALLVSAACFLLNLPLSSLPSAVSGLSLVVWYQGLELARPLLLLAGTALVVWRGGGLVDLAFATGGATLVVSLIAVGIIAVHQPHVLLPTRGAGSTQFTPGTIYRASGYFFLLGLATTAVLGTDNIIINAFLSSEEVTGYAVYFRLFSYGATLAMATMSPFFVVYGKAYSHDDWPMLRRAYAFVGSVVPAFASLVAVGGIALGPLIVELWTGQRFSGGEALALIFAAYTFVRLLVFVQYSLLISISSAFVQMVPAVLEAGLNLALSLLLVRWLGSPGVALATLLAALCTSTVAAPWLVHRFTGGRIRPLPRAAVRQTIVLPPLLAAAWAIAQLADPFSRIAAGAGLVAVTAGLNIFFARHLVSEARTLWAQRRALRDASSA